MTITVAVDCMGGDFGLASTLPASLASLKRDPALDLKLFGDHATIEQGIAKWPASLRARCDIVATTQTVDMGESPTGAYRKKRDSSLRKAIDAVSDGTADAVVSSGNTGALALIATLVLRPIDGLERSAIAAYLPTSQGQPVLMLDLGANASCTAEHLQQFAMMGSALAQANGIANPSIGLLNIGEELGKGNDTYKQAYTLIEGTTSLNFYGNVEGTDIYKRTVDVVVCDGFVGNIALKSSEGLASMIKSMMTEEFTRSWWTKVLAVLSYPVLAAFKRRVDHRRFSGAVLLGLSGIVIKSHGSSDATAFAFAIGRAFDAAQSKLVDRLRLSLANAADTAAPSVLA
jgi:glycerol-3-phosphate acyltransferase PlsX